MHVTYLQHVRTDMISFSRLFRTQNSRCMCHGSGAVSSLFLLVILRVATVEIHRCRASITSAPTLATFGAGCDGTAECASKFRTRVRRSSEQDCTAGPCGPARWTTWNSNWPRVLGRSDKWDGGEKTWPNWSFLMQAFAGGIDQELSTNMTNAESSGDVLSNEAMTGQRNERIVQLHFILIMFCTVRALDRIANPPHGCGMEAWRLLFQAMHDMFY